MVSSEETLSLDATSKLPTEILCYIFEEYIQIQFLPTESTAWYSTERGYVRFFPVTEAKVPLGLGAICRRWRQAAWGHPRLWSTLAVRLDASTMYPVAHLDSPELVSQWLKRAGNLPLRIRLKESRQLRSLGSQPGIDAETSKAVVRVMNAYSPRWQSLEFDDILYEALEVLHVGGEDGDPSILQTVSLKANAEAGRAPVPLWEGFSKRHHPAHVSFAGGYSPTDFDIDWASVTHAYADNMYTFNAPQAVLECCALSSITHLVLYCLYADDCPNVELKHLIHLVIINAEDADLRIRGAILDALTVPALKTLRFDEFEEAVNPVFPLDSFFGFIDRSDCTIEDFELMKPFMDDTDVVLMLELVPSLTRLALWLRERNDSTIFFKALSPSRVNPPGLPFLPLLKRLEFTARAPRPWSALTDVFEPDPRVPGHPRTEHPRTGLRRNLIISFHLLKEPDRTIPYIERSDLLELIGLWVTVRCLINIDANFDPTWTGDQHIFSISGARALSEDKFADQIWCKQIKAIPQVHRTLWNWLQDGGPLPIPLPTFVELPRWF